MCRLLIALIPLLLLSSATAVSGSSPYADKDMRVESCWTAEVARQALITMLEQSGANDDAKRSLNDLKAGKRFAVVRADAKGLPEGVWCVQLDKHSFSFSYSGLCYSGERKGTFTRNGGRWQATSDGDVIDYISLNY